MASIGNASSAPGGTVTPWINKPHSLACYLCMYGQLFQIISSIDVMEQQYNYDTRLDVKYNHLELIDIPKMVAACTDKWFNQTLTRVNESVVRVGIVEGEYHWHKHDNDDEFFFVLEGQLLVDLEDRTIVLNPQQGVTVSKGIMHRTRALQKTVMLMVETAGIKPTGD